MRLRRLSALVSVAALAVTGFVLAPPAQAVTNLGLAIWDGSELTPEAFPSAAVNDEFAFNNGTGGLFMLVNASGAVSVGGQTCIPHACYVSSTATVTATVLTLGSIDVYDVSGSFVAATLTLGSGGGGGSAPTLVASQPPGVVATPGNGVVQLSITPGSGGTAPAQLYGIEYRPTTSCPFGRSSSPRLIAPIDTSCGPCPRVLDVGGSSDPCAAVQSASVAAEASGSATATITGLVNGRNYEFSVKEMTTDQLWSGATTATATPTESVVCTTLSVTVAQPAGSGAATVTSPVSATAPTVYPFIAPPYGGTVKQPAMGAWSSATSTGSAGGEYATFTPTTDKPCPVTVTAPEGTRLSGSTGGGWNGGSQSLTVYGGSPVYVFGTKTGTYDIGFAAGANGALKATPKVMIGTVPEAAYSIALSPSSQELSTGGFGTLKLSVTDVFGNPVSKARVAASASGQVLFGGYANAQEGSTGSDGSATLTLIAANSAGSGTVTAAAPSGTNAWAWQTNYVKPAGVADPVKAATVNVTVTSPVTKRITIAGTRGTVSGKPGVIVDGYAEYFAAGDTFKPWVKFPGQVEYTEGSARPAIDAAGSFTWSRKTGKKTYVYFTSDDGKIRSNTVIIPAN